jgi:aspartate dehydrogenase
MERELTVGIAGLGAIGLNLARALDGPPGGGGVPGLTLVAVSARDRSKARTNVEDFVVPPRIVTNAELATLCDIVVNCP